MSGFVLLHEAGVGAPLVHVGEVRIALQHVAAAGGVGLRERGAPAAPVGVVAVHDRSRGWKP